MEVHQQVQHRERNRSWFLECTVNTSHKSFEGILRYSRYNYSTLRDWYLQAEDADKGPFAVVLDWSLRNLLPSKLLTNHALVAALADTVPLLPAQVQGLLQELLVGRIDRLLRQNVALQIHVHWKVAAIVAHPIYTSCLLTTLHTGPATCPSIPLHQPPRPKHGLQTPTLTSMYTYPSYPQFDAKHFKPT